MQRQRRRVEARRHLAQRAAARDGVVLPAELADDEVARLEAASFDSTTSPSDWAVITSPISTGFAYERAVLMRPRWYGSTEIQSMRTSTSPGPGSGAGCSTSAKFDSVREARRS